ncbi:hypothetical protein FNL56_06105 [Tardiphaga sp. vice304]|uniref:hypothetical protein n=1 Tax=unclassified Tardiphaga TaxID=2631404 RepID=UPI0011658059|nr:MULTISPECIES: hypothetical protein [unclassified Tardiphaga]QDM20598.1 hypothetical protein FIU28_05235 [Tardiphaga sp. vice154]QDM25729.1 hypothetical protein FNL56_06105 [Tardiphaga sp. vice304]
MPFLLVRRDAIVRAYPDEFRVILVMADGYEFEVGGIAKQTGAKNRVFWQWSCPGGAGQSARKGIACATASALVKNFRDECFAIHNGDDG